MFFDIKISWIYRPKKKSELYTKIFEQDFTKAIKIHLIGTISFKWPCRINWLYQSSYDKEFERLNWLPVTETSNQRINSIVNNQCPNYLNKVFQTAPENNIQTRESFLKLKCPFCKTNAGQIALSYIGPAIWSKTPDTLQWTKNLNTLKHNLKEN